MLASPSNNHVPNRRNPHHRPPKSNSSKQFQDFQSGFDNGVAKTLAFSTIPSELHRPSIRTIVLHENAVPREPPNTTIEWKLFLA